MRVHVKTALTVMALLWLLVGGASTQSDVRVKMEGVEQTRYDRDGEIEAVIWAERVTMDDTGTLVMEEVSTTVYTDDDKEVQIEARRGAADTEGTGDAVFEGELTLRFSDLAATTSRAKWCESDRTVRGNDEIVLEGRGSRIVGSGFTVFTSDERAIIYRPRGSIQLEELRDESGQDKGKGPGAPPKPGKVG